MVRYGAVKKKAKKVIEKSMTVYSSIGRTFKKLISTVTNILSAKLHGLKFTKTLSTIINTISSFITKYKQIEIDVVLKPSLPKDVLFSLTENQDIAFTLTQDNDVTIQADDITDLIYDSKLDKYTK